MDMERIVFEESFKKAIITFENFMLDIRHISVQVLSCTLNSLICNDRHVVYTDDTKETCM